MNNISPEDLCVHVDPLLRPFFHKALFKFQSDCATIKSYLSHSDYEAIRFVAHNLKGEGGSYGIDKVSEIGRKMEVAARIEKRETIEDLLNDLSYLVNYIQAV